MLSTVQPPERRASPLLSNNPFRNRAASPNALPSPSSPNFRVGSSKNPFLDSSEQPTSATMNGRTSPEKTVDLFSSLNLDDKKPASSANPSIRRPENLPPKSDRSMPPPGHRPARSRDEDERRRRDNQRRAAPKNNDTLDIFADPVESKPRPRQRARRNSDTSLVDRNSRSLETEEERRKRKQKEREARRKDKTSGSTKPKVPGHRLDVIDKLDVTSIFGTGVFHHDGPFDACNPNRNRRGLRAAPMAAFPKDSANMAIGGSGPLNKDVNHAQIHGVGAEGFSDFAKSGAATDNDVAGRPRFDDKGVMFEAAAKVEPVHGPESHGLGTSTFLEGAPASRAAIQRRESENEAAMTVNGMNGGGLGRKKSLAQRIRGISNGRPAGMGSRMNGGGSPEPNYTLQRSMTQSPPLATPQSAGGNASDNPFFQDYDKEYEKKGAKIAIAEGSGSRARGLSSPTREIPTLNRAITNDGLGGGESSKPSGFLNRVKSLKGGPRRTRPERREVS